MLGAGPREGTNRAEVAFVHSNGSGSVLFELTRTNGGAGAERDDEDGDHENPDHENPDHTGPR